MPNGRSGGFLIPQHEMEQLLKALTDDSVVGHALASLVKERKSFEPSAGVGPAAVIAMLDDFWREHEHVWVEEQDETVYIIHLDLEVQEHGEPNIKKWIIVRADSPLFGPLRQRHQLERTRRQARS